MYSFLVVLGLCTARGLPLVAVSRGCPPAAGCGPLLVEASPAVERQPWGTRLSSHAGRASCPQHVGPSKAGACARVPGISRQALEPRPPGKPHRALSLPLSGSRFSRRHHTDSRPGKRPLLCVLPLSRRLYPIQGPSRGHMACRRTSLFLSRRQLRLWSA